MSSCVTIAAKSKPTISRYRNLTSGCTFLQLHTYRHRYWDGFRVRHIKRLEKLANVTSLWQSDRARPWLISMSTNVVASPIFNSKVLESATITDSIAHFDGDGRMASSTYNAIYTISPPTWPVNTHRSLHVGIRPISSKVPLIFLLN